MVFLIFIKTKGYEIVSQVGLKLVGLEINRGINDEYLCALHGSVVVLHVGGADLQELEQQGCGAMPPCR